MWCKVDSMQQARLDDVTRLRVCLSWFPALAPACVCLPTTALLFNTAYQSTAEPCDDSVLARLCQCMQAAQDVADFCRNSAGDSNNIPFQPCSHPINYACMLPSTPQHHATPCVATCMCTCCACTAHLYLPRLTHHPLFPQCGKHVLRSQSTRTRAHEL